jgi:hypothetical protein
MDTGRTVNTLRDVVLRRRSGLPIPSDVDIDDLLEDAANTIEQLQIDLDNAEEPW